MQTLNVGAGQSEAKYKESAEHRRADLRSSSQNEANFFFWAAGLAALGTGLLPIRINFLVSIGAIELLRYYGQPVGQALPLLLYGAAGLWVVTLLVLAFAARSGLRWAFIAGMVLYAADMMSLIVMFSLWAFGVHAFFVYRWFLGQQALKELDDPALATT